MTDIEAGDVPARTTATCRHGWTGYCWDDALPQERKTIQHLWDAAVEYARDEQFAEWLIGRVWRPGVVQTDITMPNELEEYKRQRTRPGTCNRSHGGH